MPTGPRPGPSYLRCTQSHLPVIPVPSQACPPPPCTGPAPPARCPLPLGLSLPVPPALPACCPLCPQACLPPCSPVPRPPAIHPHRPPALQCPHHCLPELTQMVGVCCLLSLVSPKLPTVPSLNPSVLLSSCPQEPHLGVPVAAATAGVKGGGKALLCFEAQRHCPADDRPPVPQVADWPSNPRTATCCTLAVGPA